MSLEQWRFIPSLGLFGTTRVRFVGVGARAFWICSVVACALVLMAGSQSSVSAVTINESFRNNTAPGWLLLGTATLTGGGVDPAGAGWLRLTSNVNGQAGSAIYNTAFSSTDGVQITFTYATYGGTGADGFSFYLIDGSTAVPTVGPPGAPLGYSKDTYPSPPLPGVTNGYLAVGFDEYGNFNTHWAGDCSYTPCPVLTPNSITIRGSGSLAGPGFNFYTRTGATIGTGSRVNSRKVRITVTPAPTVNVTVEVDSGSGFVMFINNFNISGIAGQAAVPATFKMGLSASTGDYNNYHEIRDFLVGGAQASSTVLGSSPNPSVCNQSVTFTATVTPSAATGSVSFMDGTSQLGTAALVNGIATFSTSMLTAGIHNITALYSGDAAYSASSSNALTQVMNCSTGALVPTMTEWGMIILTVILGIASVYYLKRLRSAV